MIYIEQISKDVDLWILLVNKYFPNKLDIDKRLYFKFDKMIALGYELFISDDEYFTNKCMIIIADKGIKNFTGLRKNEILIYEKDIIYILREYKINKIINE